MGQRSIQLGHFHTMILIHEILMLFFTGEILTQSPEPLHWVKGLEQYNTALKAWISPGEEDSSSSGTLEIAIRLPSEDSFAGPSIGSVLRTGFGQEQWQGLGGSMQHCDDSRQCCSTR